MGLRICAGKYSKIELWVLLHLKTLKKGAIAKSLVKIRNPQFLLRE
jgi:hypothetical protein